MFFCLKAPVILTVAVSSTFVLTVTLETAASVGVYEVNLSSDAPPSIVHNEPVTGNVIIVRDIPKNKVFSVTVKICEALTDPKICSSPSNSKEIVTPQSGWSI